MPYCRNIYFPADLRIWSSSGNKDDYLLLIDALEGKFIPASRNWAVASGEVPLLFTDKVNPNYSGRNNWVNLPSSTPKQSSARECPPTADVSLLGSIDLHSPAAATPDSTALELQSWFLRTVFQVLLLMHRLTLNRVIS
ncbi:hypothetical protein POM88_049305 [Heracleum sosnowskyi]|uniref:Uncharacterized protein n=1 Tax=Heracleum sosnowskyi TaxID=360622 RepID=A0AAD8GWP8_9APIA|nr:hypothetical protein POM88_049305 [Heracleum sosnowskyi]